MDHLWSLLVVRESFGLFVYATYSNLEDEKLLLPPPHVTAQCSTFLLSLRNCKLSYLPESIHRNV